MDRASVVAAAAGVQLIVHAVNPPGYRNWKGTVLPMTENSIAAAKASGARLVIPGNVYNFAPDAGPAIAEDAPQVPATRKGAIRVEMERRLRQASRDGVRVLILRAGDFFGPAAPNSALACCAEEPRPHCRRLQPRPGRPRLRLHARSQRDLAQLADGRIASAPTRCSTSGSLAAHATISAGAAPRHRPAEAADPRLPLARRAARRALQRDVPRAAGDAVPLAKADRPRQRQAGRLPREEPHTRSTPPCGRP